MPDRSVEFRGFSDDDVDTLLSIWDDNGVKTENIDVRGAGEGTE